MDHPGLAAMTFIVNQSVAIVIDDILNDGSSLTDYFNFHNGPIAVPGGCEGMAFIDPKIPGNTDGDPYLELLFFGSSIASEGKVYKSLGISDHIYNTVYKPMEKIHAWTDFRLSLKPKSRGRIMLKSSNTFHKPLIYYDFFEDPSDLEVQLVGVKKILELSNTKAFQKYGSKLHDYPINGCEHLKFGSDDYWRCVIRHLSSLIFHLSGTCKMGPISDSCAVVDQSLRVYGIKGLRVIDAFIMPMLPSAHTKFPSMVLGVKGAAVVKQDWTMQVP
jgi:choline dehydrogenase